MRAKSGEGLRPRISVSLDEEDYSWLVSLPGPSDSFRAAQAIRAARLAGLRIDSAEPASELQRLAEWLQRRPQHQKLAFELSRLLAEFLK